MWLVFSTGRSATLLGEEVLVGAGEEAETEA
jgi:hypothetical protein